MLSSPNTVSRYMNYEVFWFQWASVCGVVLQLLCVWMQSYFWRFMSVSYQWSCSLLHCAATILPQLSRNFILRQPVSKHPVTVYCQWSRSNSWLCLPDRPTFYWPVYFPFYLNEVGEAHLWQTYITDKSIQTNDLINSEFLSSRRDLPLQKALRRDSNDY